jgi:hypothetical protein
MQLAGAAIDKGDTERGAEIFERAMDLNVRCATTYFFRSQVTE